MSAEMEVVKGDITQSKTQVIVNAANNEFWMGSGVAGAIKAAGGQVIEEEAMAKGPVMPGEVIHTTAGKLRFAYVFHAAVMGQDLRTTAQLIRTCTLGCLNLAEKLKIESIALPAFGTGVGQFPVKACGNLMIGTTWAFKSQLYHLKRVQFCLFQDVAHKLFSVILAEKINSQL